ncbi:hypothetical protein KO561_01900 [Radiobacillus kanasensis]|uniref:hypothetical protein n=1 Tax=Radiobacillus kanasensis TaxID=2844358 RepID=UPI001E3F07E7|nr:hypothetical protein [Radiobacillus kanasensis]UFT99753.1 hypothetical protein KO561_01900 [Radiobacillus kanasensis]
MEEMEHVIQSFQLIISSKTTLLSKKGSYHWHLKKDGEKGVLEITYWPSKSKLLVEIARNRMADWNVSIIEEMTEAFANTFQGQAQPLTEK